MHFEQLEKLVETMTDPDFMQDSRFAKQYLEKLLDNTVMYNFALDIDNYKQQLGYTEEEYKEKLKEYIRPSNDCLLRLPCNPAGIEDRDGLIIFHEEDLVTVTTYRNSYLLVGEFAIAHKDGEPKLGANYLYNFYQKNFSQLYLSERILKKDIERVSLFYLELATAIWGDV